MISKSFVFCKLQQSYDPWLMLIEILCTLGSLAAYKRCSEDKICFSDNSSFHRANNLPQFIHKITIKFKFRKSMAQERLKSNLEYRYQIKVPSIEFRKGFAKFMIQIALFKEVSKLIISQ